MRRGATILAVVGQACQAGPVLAVVGEQVRAAQASRIPGLDGLRALSIGAVVLSHTLAGSALGPQPVAEVAADDGVMLFFALSGFLITTLLVREHDRSATISLRGFYRRRILRIWPVWYVFLLAVALLGALGALSLPWPSLFAAGTFLWGWWPAATSFVVQHSWSLSIEEQFYLLWPVTLIALLSRRRPVTWVAAGLALAPLVHVLYYLLLPGLRDRGQGVTAYRLDPLLAGALAAFILRDERVLAVVRGFVGRYLVMAAGAVLAGDAAVRISFPRHEGAYVSSVGTTIVGTCMAVLVLSVVLHPGSAPVRLLCAPPMVFLGLISFSLYVWQQPLLRAGFLGPVSHFPVNLALSLVVAVLSWRFIELPVGRLRHTAGRLSAAVPAEARGGWAVTDAEAAAPGA